MLISFWLCLFVIKLYSRNDIFKQICQIESKEFKLMFSFPQGSILGPLLFSIHLCDLFYFLEDLDIARYAGDTTIYTVNKKKSQSLVH